jgi:WhiB family transcriptional regulator, redox-sensing transcriptional regulator
MRIDLIVEYEHPIRPLVMGTSRRLLADGSSYADVTRTDDLRGDGVPWWTHARCNDGDGSLVDVFFSGELEDIARAKRLCLCCPALVPCLEGALERREPWGVWGGQLFLDGTIVATKRRRGRPRKVPRPGDQLPEVPLPEHLRAVPVA